MEKKVIVQGPIGAIGSYEVAFENGDLKATTSIKATQLAIEGLKKAKDLIPGHFDDIAIDLAISKLEQL